MAIASQPPGLFAPFATGLRRGDDLVRARFLCEIAIEVTGAARKRVTKALSLSELYALIGDGRMSHSPSRPSLGFARVLR